MYTLYIFRIVILVIIATFYLILYFSQKKSHESLYIHHELHHGSPRVDEDAYVRNIKLSMKFEHQCQCGFMVVATVVLAIFDSRYYIIAAMFCATLAAAHLYLAQRLDV